MKFFASKQIQRVSNFSLALMLVVSTISASVPFLFSEKADAAPGVTYTNESLVPSDWSVDRAVPSGGWTVDASANQRVILNVNQANANTSQAFYQTEGVSKALPAGTDTVKADLYVAADWATKPSLRVGLWGVTQDAGLTGPSYPIIEYANIAGYTGWRVWNANNGQWTNVTAPTNIGGQNTVEIVSNFNTGNYDFYVNENKVLSYASEGYATFTNLIFNNYNAATGDTAGNYSVIWKNIQKGVVAPDYNNVYVSTTGNDAAYGTSAAFAFATIQKALDTVNVNGTVHVTDGVYNGTAQFKKNGTKLIGQSGNRDAVEIHVLPSSGQGGVYAETLNDITIKNVAVIGTTQFTNGGLIKLSNGTNGVIDNVVVKSRDAIVSGAARTFATGININSYANISINNTYVAGLGNDGISFVGLQNNGVVTKNVSITNTSVSGSGWSGIAFYTKNASITGVTFQNNRVQYGDRGIFIDGNNNTNTVTGPNGGTLNLANTVIKDNTNEYINNEQTADINAVGVVFDHQARANWDDVAAKNLTPAELAVVQTTRIKDATGKNPTNLPYGVVYLQAPSAPVLATTLTTLNATQPTKNVAWTHPGTNVNHFEYREYINEAAAIADDAYYAPSVASADRTKSVGGSWGTHTLYYAVVAVDNAGNRSLRSEVGKIVIDRDAPVIAASADANTVVKGTKTFTITQTEANPATTYVEYMQKDVNGDWEKKQGQEFVATNSASLTVNTENWNDGLHQIKVTSKDVTGNASGYAFTVTVDNEDPQITLKTGSEFTIGSNNVFSKVSFALYDNNNIAYYKVNETVNPVSVNKWSDANFITVGSNNGGQLGLNTITLFDVAGNSVSQNFTLDNVIATPTLESPAANATVNGASLTQTWSTTDTDIDIDHYIYQSYNDAAGTSLRFTDNYTTTSKTATNVANGTFYWRVTAIDKAGNVSAPTALWKITIDNSVPGVTINTIASNPTTISGTVTEAATVKISVDGATAIEVPTTDRTWSIPNPATAQGTHTVSVVATDAADNTTSPAVTTTFLIDTVAPELTVKPVTGTGSTPTFSGTAEPGSVLTVTFNGRVVDIANNNGSWSYTSPTLTTPGTYAFSITARDAQGNGTTSTASATYAVTPPAAASGNTPAITGPATAVLGETTENSAPAATNVKGATDNKVAAAVDSDATNGTVFGLAWYWWILILAAIAALAWFIIAAIRRRNEEQA